MCDAVAIIELGKIVAAGPVNAIQTTSRALALLEISVLRDSEHAEQWLRDQPDVGEVVASGNDFMVHFPADREAQAGLLERMIHARLPVVSFQSRHENLEDVFMAVTKGKVQ
jgi:ABC-type uncharacterized transport system ATPase subunit